MRRRRKRTSVRYRLLRFLRENIPARRRRHYRVINRKRFILAQCALVAVAVAALGLSASVIVRSLRTAHTNRKLAQLHTVEAGAAPKVEIAAPAMLSLTPAGADPVSLNGAGRADGDAGLKLSYMSMPDGSEIKTGATMDMTSATLHDTAGDILPDMLKLLKSNPDTVGWLYIKGTVSLPVVYRDNQYYLTHDFYGHHNASGTLFLDENHPLTAEARNLLIHGHSMYDGSMFGLLTHYQKIDFTRSHPLISFSTLWEKETYVVFAVLKVPSNANDPRYFDYMSRPAFVTDGAFNDYVRKAQERSIHEIPVEVAPNDALLTLSTCLDDDRLVVLARKQRDNETKDELISAVELSY